MGLNCVKNLPKPIDHRGIYSKLNQAPRWHLHGRVGVAERAGLYIHVVLHDRLSVAKLHDGHGVGQRGRDGLVLVHEASIISQAGGVASLPLYDKVSMRWRRAELEARWLFPHTLAQARSTLAW